MEPWFEPASRCPAGRVAALALLIGLSLGATGCGGGGSEPAQPMSPVAVEPAYEISPYGGTPATGPGSRYNQCERIWCLTHGENFFIDHFLTGHFGWILHDDDYGDVYAPRHRQEGPPFPRARLTVLLLCGQHVHPYRLGRGGGPVLHTGFNRALAYKRTHFNRFGTHLDPCCTNGLGSAYIHTRADRTFRFHDLSYYRAHPEWGWQRPFKANPASAPR